MAVTDQTAPPSTQQPPPQPPQQSNVVQDTALAAVAATLLPTPPNPAALPIDTIATLSTKLLGALRSFQSEREAGFQDELQQEANRFGPNFQAVATQLISRELGYEATFRGKQFDRVQAQLQEALSEPDKTSRNAKVRQIFEDERRYTQMREVAMRQRVVRGIEHYALEQHSPDGAFWQLGEARTHTPDCVAMSGKHWPWSVLHDFQPPVHPRCACRLISTEQAISHGLMNSDDIQDPMDAQAEAVAALRLAQEARGDDRAWRSLQEAAYDLRYPKGTANAGKFRPRVGGDPGAQILKRMGVLGRGQHHSPLRDRDGMWTRLAGRYVRIPHGEWRSTINGIQYHSPEGSTNVYKEGQLISAPVAREGETSRLHDLAQSVREQLRSKLLTRRGAPLRAGDGPHAVASMEARGYDMTDVAPAGKGVWRVGYAHPNGARAYAHVTQKGVRSARWEPTPAEHLPLARAAVGPSMSFEAHAADMKSWAGELAERYGDASRFRRVDIDKSLGNHAGHQDWNGDVHLGPYVARDINQAADRRAAGKALSDRQARGVYASMVVSAHEIGHTVNPLSAKDGHVPENKNLEEALTEEMAHRLAAERLASQGQSDVLDWARRNPTNLVTRGVYLHNRGALADLFDRAGLTDEQKAQMVEQLKFKINPKDRFKALGDMLHQANPSLSEADAEATARDAMRQSSSSPRPVLASPGLPDHFKKAYEEIAKVVGDTALPIVKPEKYKRPEPAPKTIIGGGKKPATQGPIPSYRHVPLELGGKDFYTAAQKATDEQGKPWIIQAHDSDTNRVASELLAGAIYKTLGVPVAQPGTVQMSPEPDFSQVPDELADEPPVPEKGRLSTGIILMNKKGDVTIVEPRNHYAGYIHTFPKGGVEKGLTPQQNAHKELWEESGLHGHITGVVGDFKGQTGTTRYYLGVKTGGKETPSDETQAVKTVSTKDAAGMLNMQRDKDVLSAVMKHTPPTGTFKDNFPKMVKQLASAYPVPAGKKITIDKPNAQLSAGYMADALLGNWDFVGHSGDNLRWDGDDKPPTRVNLGSTFEYRPDGKSKPFEQVPSDVWTMLRRGQGRGKIDLTDEQMRAQASKIANELTIGKIHKLVQAAPFTDQDMRQRVEDALTARVKWMRDYGDGLIDMPQPASGDDADKLMADAHDKLDVYPEEQAAIQDYQGAMRDRIDEIARNTTKAKASKSEADTIGHLDSVIDATDVPDDIYGWIGLPNGAGAGLAGKTVKQRSFTPLSTTEPDGPRMRVMVPGGARALYLEDHEPDASNILLPRESRLQVDHVSDDGDTVHATLMPYQKPVKVLPPWSGPKTTSYSGNKPYSSKYHSLGHAGPPPAASKWRVQDRATVNGNEGRITAVHTNGDVTFKTGDKSYRMPPTVPTRLK